MLGEASSSDGVTEAQRDEGDFWALISLLLVTAVADNVTVWKILDQPVYAETAAKYKTQIARADFKKKVNNMYMCSAKRELRTCRTWSTSVRNIFRRCRQ